MSAKKDAPDQPEDCDVFISYSHDSPAHRGKVKQLATALEAAGYSVTFDQQRPVGPDEGWPNYMADRIGNAKHWIVVLSEGYGKGRGSKFELTTMRNIQALQSQAQRVSKAYFDPAYDANDYRAKNGLPDLGDSFYSLEKGCVSGNLKWIALLERLQLNTGKKAEGYLETEVHHGIILVGDIVGFSDARRFYPHKQELVLRQMWNFLKNHKSIKSANCPLDSTLDGAIVVFDELYHKGHQPLSEIALDFAIAWIRFMRGGVVVENEVIEVPFRIGMDLGRYSQFRLDEQVGGDKGHLNLVMKVVGAGPNDCDRLTRIGDEYDIIVGNHFYEELRQNSKRDLNRKIFPPPGEPALEVFPKPNHKQLVRVYPGVERKPHEYTTPMLLRQAMAASENLESILKSVCDDFHDWLREELLFDERSIPESSREDGKGENRAELAPEVLACLAMLEPKKSQPRVSIFARKPDDPENTLSCTTFRELDGVRKGSKLHLLLTRPKTEYAISDGGKGIVGRAFHSKKPIVLHDLPDWTNEQGKIDYLTAMRKFGLDEQAVVGFSRHPRQVICFRCVFGTLPPDAVVCIDSMSLLPEIPPPAFEQLSDYLQRTYGPIISVLLRIRT